MATRKKTGGRALGTPNKITSDLRQRINDFLNDNFEQIQKDFKKLEPRDKMMFYEKLLSFGLPKLQSVELKNDIESMIEKLTDDQAEKLLIELSKKAFESL